MENRRNWNRKKNVIMIKIGHEYDKDGISVWCCGSCGATMYHVYEGVDEGREYAKFCRQCGKPVKWGGVYK